MKTTKLSMRAAGRADEPEGTLPSGSYGFWMVSYYVVVAILIAFIAWQFNNKSVLILGAPIKALKDATRTLEPAAAPTGAPAGSSGGKPVAEAPLEVTPAVGAIGPLHSPTWLFVFCLIVGAAGGWLHGLSSFTMRAGRRTLYTEWTLFYLTRPLVGAVTAMFFYLVLAGNVAGMKIEGTPEGERSLLAWCALAGLFSTVAMQKLRDVFEAVFRPNREAEPQRAAKDRPLPPADVQPPTHPVAPPPPGK